MNTNNNTKAFTKDQSQRTVKTPRPEPVYDNFQNYAIRMITEQANYYIANGNSEDYDLRKGAESGLFNITSPRVEMCCDFTDDGDCVDNETADPIALCMLERSLRFDKERHTLKRASVSIVVLKAGLPAYFITAYMNAERLGNVSVIPFDGAGPVYRNTMHGRFGPDQTNN